MIHQLRIYEIFESNKRAFHDRFRDHAVRIMAGHGFQIVGMWETETTQRSEFVYLLQWPDTTAMERGWEAFMTDPDWMEIKRQTSAEHGSLVGGIESRVLRAVDYGPEPAAPLG